MTFIIILISFLIERFFDWSHLRQWRWFTKFQTWLSLRFKKLSPAVVLAICILPPVILIACINFLLTVPFYGLFKVIFGIAIVVYCLGPQNLWAQLYACLHDMDNQETQEKIRRMFGVTTNDDPQNFHRAFTNAIFIAAHNRIFAIFFWFLILGPAGAMLYRLTDLCKTRGIGINLLATQLLNLLDWPSIRVFTIIFALGGHFKKVLHQWKLLALAPPPANDNLLTECGIAALDISYEQRIPEDGLAEREALDLLDRTFIMTLVILALAVLI